MTWTLHYHHNEGVSAPCVFSDTAKAFHSHPALYVFWILIYDCQFQLKAKRDITKDKNQQEIDFFETFTETKVKLTNQKP